MLLRDATRGILLFGGLALRVQPNGPTPPGDGGTTPPQGQAPTFDKTTGLGLDSTAWSFDAE